MKFQTYRPLEVPVQTPINEAEHPKEVEPTRKLISAISFRKQLGRASFSAQGQDVNEKRFETLNLCPSVSSLHRRVRTPSMKQYLPRDNRTFKTLEFLPTYTPKFDFIMKDLGKTGMPFHRQLSKPSMEIKTMNDLVYEHTDAPLLRPRVSSPDFALTTSRHSKSGTPLPTFMHYNASRLSVQGVNHKMLEMNHFADGEFQTVYSGFSQSLPMSPKHVAFTKSMRTSRLTSPQRRLSPRKIG
jgi:hypothetical protein